MSFREHSLTRETNHSAQIHPPKPVPVPDVNSPCHLPHTAFEESQVKTSNPDDQVCFASSGTIGIVDLGASQTVVGHAQVKEILDGLPSKIREQVRTTSCQLTFRFGNHQTLSAKHALLLPLKGQWFRIAIVDGNTPFLLSASFLKFIGAVVDAEAHTLWSKSLGKYLEVNASPRNLMLVDLNELWSEDAINDTHFSLQQDPTGAKCQNRDQPKGSTQPEISFCQPGTLPQSSATSIRHDQPDAKDESACAEDQSAGSPRIREHVWPEQEASSCAVSDIRRKETGRRNPSGSEGQDGCPNMQQELSNDAHQEPGRDVSDPDGLGCSVRGGEQLVNMQKDQLNMHHRMSGLESAMQEMITHLKGLQVKTEN
eukprot:s1428_g17.t1